MKLIKLTLEIIVLAWAFNKYKHWNDFNIPEDVKQRVVKIATDDGEHSAQGTGTLIGKNRILTCAHLFNSREDYIMFRRHNSPTYQPATIEKFDPERDFAILRFIGDDKTLPLKISNNWKLGESIGLLGNPLEGDFIEGHSRILAMTMFRTPNGYRRFFLTFPCDTGGPGFSGSGIWNSKGEYLGLFELGSNSLFHWGDICFAVTSEEILNNKLMGVK